MNKNTAVVFPSIFDKIGDMLAADVASVVSVDITPLPEFVNIGLEAMTGNAAETSLTGIV